MSNVYPEDGPDLYYCHCCYAEIDETELPDGFDFTGNDDPIWNLAAKLHNPGCEMVSTRAWSQDVADVVSLFVAVEALPEMPESIPCICCHEVSVSDYEPCFDCQTEIEDQIWPMLSDEDDDDAMGMDEEYSRRSVVYA